MNNPARKPLPLLTENDRVRFSSKVDETTSCWSWTARIDRAGYGVFKVGRTPYLAHRISYYICYGIDPGDYCVLHRCDNRKCVNPEHLFRGTYADINRGKAKKGRGQGGCLKGSDSGRSKLVESDISKIRSYLKSGQLTQREIAAQFGVTQGTVWFISKGLTWTHVKESKCA